MPEPLAALLRNTWPWPDDAPGADALAAAAPLFRPRPVRRGTVLLAQGEVWQHTLLIERGVLRLHFVQADGREFNKNFFADGALVCPLTPAMWGAPSLFAISCTEAGQIWSADATAWRATMDASGHWAPLRTELLARLVTHKLQREHDLLALDGRRRYAAFCERLPELADRVPLRHLASYLGLTDVQLSRIRRALKDGRPGGAPKPVL